jgi:hypothetical protein
MDPEVLVRVDSKLPDAGNGLVTKGGVIVEWELKLPICTWSELSEPTEWTVDEAIGSLKDRHVVLEVVGEGVTGVDPEPNLSLLRLRNEGHGEVELTLILFTETHSGGVPHWVNHRHLQNTIGRKKFVVGYSKVEQDLSVFCNNNNAISISICTTSRFRDSKSMAFSHIFTSQLLRPKRSYGMGLSGWMDVRHASTAALVKPCLKEIKETGRNASWQL